MATNSKLDLSTMNRPSLLQLALATVLTTILATSTRAAHKPIKAFILASQSNMLGWGDSTKLPDDLRRGNDRVLTFEKPVPAGRFITGDWYVVGPVTVVKITPEPLFAEAVKDHPDWEIINKQAVKEEEHYRGNWARNGSVINQGVDTHREGSTADWRTVITAPSSSSACRSNGRQVRVAPGAGMRECSTSARPANRKYSAAADFARIGRVHAWKQRKVVGCAGY